MTIESYTFNTHSLMASVRLQQQVAEAAAQFHPQKRLPPIPYNEKRRKRKKAIIVFFYNRRSTD
jgi:hypothetical protein